MRSPRPRRSKRESSLQTRSFACQDALFAAGYVHGTPPQLTTGPGGRGGYPSSISHQLQWKLFIYTPPVHLEGEVYISIALLPLGGDWEKFQLDIAVECGVSCQRMFTTTIPPRPFAQTRPITEEEWCAYHWLEVEAVGDGRRIFLRGLKKTSPPDDGYAYIQAPIRFGDTEEKWVCAETPA